MVIKLIDSKTSLLSYDNNLISNILEKYEFSNEQFKAKSVKLLSNKFSLNVMQGESIIWKAGSSKLQWLGSDNATTCCIVIVVSNDRQMVSVSHIDTSQVEPIRKVIDDLKRHSSVNNEFALHLLGAYNDELEKSIDIMKRIITELIDSNLIFNLMTSCFGSLNTVMKDLQPNKPIFYGAAINLLNYEVYPAEFFERPLLSNIRNLARMSHCELMFSYDTDEIIIDPFECDNRIISSYACAWYLKKSDHYIRKNFSTSPEAEKDDFVDSMRFWMKFLVKNPCIKDIFDSESIKCKLLHNTGEWILNSANRLTLDDL